MPGSGLQGFGYRDPGSLPGPAFCGRMATGAITDKTVARVVKRVIVAAALVSPCYRQGDLDWRSTSAGITFLA